MRLQIDKPADSAELTVATNSYGVAPQACNSATATQTQAANIGYIRLEIRSDRLFSLIDDKALVVEDLRGLDRKAKNWIKQRLLQTLAVRKR
ncbi:Uncharacterised protein [Halioglobus japonicus]|nr:Uncharacterised protein [Halioglobus japonicus]